MPPKTALVSILLINKEKYNQQINIVEFNERNTTNIKRNTRVKTKHEQRQRDDIH